MTINVDKKKSSEYIEILCIEEGSVDIKELSETGIPRENILIYRKGSKAPYLLRIKKEDKERG